MKLIYLNKGSFPRSSQILLLPSLSSLIGTHTRIHTDSNFSHPSSSQELADIFGTSDDEEDVGFPFGLNSALPVPKGFEDITLPGGNTNSLLGNTDSELFLAGFRPSPKKDSSEAKSDHTQVEDVKEKPEVKTTQAMETGNNKNDNNEKDHKKDTKPSKSLIVVSHNLHT